MLPPDPRPALTPRSRLPLSGLVGSLLVGALAAGLMLWATSTYGVNFTPDSLHYIAASRSVAAGQGFVNNYGRPLVIWPPFYSLVLAAGQAFGVGVLDWARVLNAGLLVALSMWFAGLAWRVTRSVPLAIAGAALVTCNLSMLRIFGHVWSEPLFITLLVAAALALAVYWDRRAWPWLVAAAVAIALACVQRYFGVVMLGVGTLAVFAYERSWKERFSAATIFAVVGALPLGAWVVRNYLISGSPAGVRAPAVRGVVENAKLLGGSMISPFLGPHTRLRTLGIALVAALLVALAIFIWRVRFVARWEATRQGVLVLAALFVAVYAPVLLYLESTSAAVGDHRYLSPTLPFVVLVALTALSLIAPDDPAFRRGRMGRYVNVAVVLLVCVFAVTEVRDSVRGARIWDRTGVPIGYATARRAKEPAFRWLIANARGEVIYTSRRALALELASDWVLRTERLETLPDGRRVLPASAADKRSIYVLFHDDVRNVPLDASSVANGLTLTPLFGSKGAQIYRIGPPRQ